jgi:hypothetical protein
MEKTRLFPRRFPVGVVHSSKHGVSQQIREFRPVPVRPVFDVHRRNVGKHLPVLRGVGGITYPARASHVRGYPEVTPSGVIRACMQTTRMNERHPPHSQ